MTEASENKPKRGLLLTGGGTKGAFQAGALKHLIGDLGRTYDVVTGFSIGALNGALVAQGDFDAMFGLWHGLKSMWDFVGGNPLGFYKGLLTLKPMRHIAESLLDAEKLRSSGTKLVFTTVDLQDGTLVERDENSEPLIDWLMASAAIPGVFPPVEIDGHQYVDGGVLALEPLAPAIHEGVDEIDIILCRPISNWQTEDRFDTLVETTMRSLELVQADAVRVDIRKCRTINDAVHKWSEGKDGVNFIEGYILSKVEQKDIFPLKKLRYIKLNIVEPPPELIGVLEFDREKIHETIDLGYNKAAEVFLKK